MDFQPLKVCSQMLFPHWVQRSFLETLARSAFRPTEEVWIDVENAWVIGTAEGKTKS